MGSLGWGVLVGIVLGASSARAELFVPATKPPGPTAAVEVDGDTQRLPEIDRAIKSFEEREFDACLKRLWEAVKAHPELPPADVLFAKLAFKGNLGALIRPALKRAAIEAPNHPEVYILFGNLALLEGRVTDAAVHFEKAKTLAKVESGTAERRRRFEL